MELRKTVLAEHSRANCTRTVKWVGSDQRRFDELMKLFLDDDTRLSQCAGWPVSDIVKKHPGLVTKHLGKVLAKVKKPGIHDAVKRNTVRILEFIDVPRKFHGDVMNLCFDNIISPTEKPAVKAFSLTVLENLSKKYPEILPEIRTIIEDRWDLESAAFKSRARKFLK